MLTRSKSVMSRPPSLDSRDDVAPAPVVGTALVDPPAPGFPAHPALDRLASDLTDSHGSGPVVDPASLAFPPHISESVSPPPVTLQQLLTALAHQQTEIEHVRALVSSLHLAAPQGLPAVPSTVAPAPVESRPALTDSPAIGPPTGFPSTELTARPLAQVPVATLGPHLQYHPFGTPISEPAPFDPPVPLSESEIPPVVLWNACQ